MWSRLVTVTPSPDKLQSSVDDTSPSPTVAPKVGPIISFYVPCLPVTSQCYNGRAVVQPPKQNVVIHQLLISVESGGQLQVINCEDYLCSNFFFSAEEYFLTPDFSRTTVHINFKSLLNIYRPVLFKLSWAETWVSPGVLHWRSFFIKEQVNITSIILIAFLNFFLHLCA